MEERLISLDAHLHIYPQFDPEKTLDMAFQNLQRHSALESAEMALWEPLVCLTEGSGFNFFQALANNDFKSKFTVQSLRECNAVRVLLSDKKHLTVIAGRQIKTFEGIEIHLIGDPSSIPDGEPLFGLTETLVAKGHLVVLPWGVGKWLFSKGDLVKDLYNTFPTLILSDNSSRIFSCSMIEKARTEHRLLAGTDPLPFTGEEDIVGSYATLTRTPFDPELPILSLKNMLKEKRQFNFIGKRRSAAKATAATLKALQTKYLSL